MKATKLDARGSGAVGKKRGAVDKLVLATVNAPYKRGISVAALSKCLANAKIDHWQVHVATFFTDVSPDLMFRFAASHGISKAALAKAYLATKTATGERNRNLEAKLVLVGTAAP
jgi:hypothetical protein